MEIKELKSILKKQILELEKKFPYASAFAGDTGGKTVFVSNFDKSATFVQPEKGVTFTIHDGEKFIERSIDKVDRISLENVVQELLTKYDVAEKISLEIDPGESIEKDFFIEMEIDPFDLKLPDLLKTAEKWKDKLVAISDKIINCGIRIGNQQVKELFVNRNKTLYQEINRMDSLFYAVLRDGNKTNQIWDGSSKLGGYEFLNFTVEKMKKVISDGEKILNADRINPGTYDCIFSPSMAGMFAHEAFGHGTETDMYLKNRAKGKEFMGKQVASKMVNMMDSPAYQGEAGSFFFDNEGQLASDTQIIKDGILVSGLTDMNSALQLNYKRTPNGRRENYSHKTYARMTNTYFKAGNDSLEEMIKSIEHGFLVDYPTNGMEDPKGWGIQLEGIYAREIKNGELTDKYFTPVIVTGYVPDLLNSITMIGKELKMFGGGMCGKGHKEWVKVSDGGAFMKLKARLA